MKLNINLDNIFTRILLNCIQHYNHKKYWEMRGEVINPDSKTPKIIRLYYLLRLKRMDAFHNSSMGTDLGSGAFFASPPNLLHGLNGIIISHYAKIGLNCTIFQQVTIAQGDNYSAATIGDNCTLGAGAKILGNVKIGNNVMIGANAVVVNDVPDNCLAVGIPARVIQRESSQ